MAELKATYRKVYDELVRIGIYKFSSVHIPKKRYHMMTTNIAESINSYLLTIQNMPITSIAEFIRDLLQRWFHDRRRNALETPAFLTHDVDQPIKQRILPSQRCEIYPIDFNRFKELKPQQVYDWMTVREDPGTGVLVYEVFIGETITVDRLTSESIKISQAFTIEHAPGYHVVEDCSFLVEWLPVPPNSLLTSAESLKVLI
ncbi:hypothetical protein Ddye_012871 [Dipteronia dyeriana]|uniref:Uncharacterized protein n=1 Tax=Dipteronia dyeriana TaxID=168575 RepID=A0AAD9X585_9ROSI|nr:hypothetical protein Ddye_012871 [Dipteronia dyeriana]